MNLKNIPFTAIRKGDIPRPFLPVIITNPENGLSTQTIGLVDTGADECAIPADFAEILGHDLHKGRKKTIETAGGAATGYTHTVSLNIGGYEIKHALIDFMIGLSVPLLGVRSFLKNFELNINYPKKTFSLIKKTS